MDYFFVQFQFKLVLVIFGSGWILGSVYLMSNLKYNLNFRAKMLKSINVGVISYNLKLQWSRTN